MVKDKLQSKVLECVAGQNQSDIFSNFPTKYFLQKAKLKITPVLVYDGGDGWKITGCRGDKVNDNYAIVSYANGSTQQKRCIPTKKVLKKLIWN